MSKSIYISTTLCCSLLYAVQAMHLALDETTETSPSADWRLCNATRVNDGDKTPPKMTYTGVGKCPTTGVDMDLTVTAVTGGFHLFNQLKHDCWGQFQTTKKMAKQKTPLTLEFAFVKTGTDKKVDPMNVYFTLADIDAGWKAEFGKIEDLWTGQNSFISVDSSDTSNMVASSSKDAKFADDCRPDNLPLADQKGAVTVLYSTVSAFNITVVQLKGKFRKLNFKFAGKSSLVPLPTPSPTPSPTATPTPYPTQLNQIWDCKSQIDMFLVLDGSGSVGSTGWRQTINAAVNIVKAIKPAANRSHMELIWYSSSVTVLHSLDGNEAGMISSLKSRSHPGGGTATHLALDKARTELQKTSGRSEPIVMLLTDGKANNQAASYTAATEMKKYGRLIVVPVGPNVPMADVQQWASSPKDIVPVTSFTLLDTPPIINEMISTACRDVEPGGQFTP